MYNVEKILPDSQNSASKSVQVARMFDEIAPKYDVMNHTLSFYFDKMWRRQCIAELAEIRPQKILDVATGTGDLAIAACQTMQPEKVTAIDISEQMMNVGRAKTAKIGLQDKIVFEKQNVSALSFADCSFDAITVAFGVRNFEDLDGGLREILRVLRPNGKLAMLELTTPEKFPARQMYLIYSRLIPLFGKIFAKNISAYRYLPKSISAFPQNAEMTAIMCKNGFADASFRTMTFGSCSLYIGRKK